MIYPDADGFTAACPPPGVAGGFHTNYRPSRWFNVSLLDEKLKASYT